MPESDAVIRFPEVDPDQLARAVYAAITAAGELTGRLRKGAEQSLASLPADRASAQRFQTLLELGYLVASADGFADAERSMLAALLERVTSSAIDHQALELHFRDLDQAVAVLGRRQRLARTAAELDDHSEAEEAVRLVATIAMADGCLSRAEHLALMQFGEHVGITPETIDAWVQECAQRVREGLQ